MFEKEIENFSEKDIQLSPEARKQMSDEDFRTDEQVVEDIHEPVLDEEIEIGELIKDDVEPEEKFDKDGFNDKGFDKDGFNDKGFNEDGKDKDDNPEFNSDGFNSLGFDKDGKDKDGKPEFDDKGFDKAGFNDKGLDDKGFNKDGFNETGETPDGRKKEDFTDGFDKDGFNPLGFNKDGKDKDGNTAPEIETPEKEQPESKEDALVFQDIVDGKKDVSITDKDGNEINLKDVLTDWSNNENWKKSNTEKAQELGREKDAHESVVKTFDEKNVTLDKAVETLSKNSEFMEQADEFFGGKENNPIRKIFETVEQSKESVATRTKQEEKDLTEQTEKVQKTFDDEVALLIAQDDKFNDNRELQKVFKIASEKQVSITTAYELSKIPMLAEKQKVNDEKHKTELKEVNDKLSKSQEELKKRNKEVKDLKANPKLIEPDEDSELAVGADKEVDDSTADGWGSATDRIKEKWGIKKR